MITIATTGTPNSVCSWLDRYYCSILFSDRAMVSFSSRRDVCTSTMLCISMVLCEEKALYPTTLPSKPKNEPHTFQFTHCSIVYVHLPDSKIVNGTINAAIICNSSLPLSGNRKKATKRVTGVHR